MKNEDVFNKSELLYHRNWSNKAIKELLPPPLEIEEIYSNKKYIKKVWSRKIVLEKEKTEQFQQYKKQKEKKQETSLKALETKKANTMMLAEQLSVDVDIISPDLLEKFSKRYYCYRNRTKKFYESVDLPTNEFILHFLTDYEIEVQKLKGKVGTRKAKVRYKNRVNKAIMSKYGLIYY